MLAGLGLALATCVSLAWKWQLGVVRTFVIVTFLAALSASAVAAAGASVPLGDAARVALVWVLTVGSATLLLAYRFYRDPQRTAPPRKDAIVSPADGVVIYVRRSHAGVLPVSDKNGHTYTLAELARTPLETEDAVVIGIAMSFTDVHINRSPIEGHVVTRRHFPGRFGSLRKPEMVFENERATTVIQGDGLQVAVVQIASRLVRQIVGFVREGEHVAMGDRLGVIRLGSQVDLVLPARNGLRIATQVGERLRAGESIVAVVERRSAARVGRPAAGQPDGALVVGEHIRGVALARSLGRRGISVWTLEPRGEAMVSLSRYTRRRFEWPAAPDEQLDCLLALAGRHQLDGWTLFPTNDETTALFARHHAELSDHFRVTVPPWEQVAWAYDKRLTHRLAASARVHQPATFLPRNREDLAKVELSFPVVLKPAYKQNVNPFTRDKAWRADNRNVLLARYDEACKFVDREAIMVQGLIRGGGESQFSYAALCVDGAPLASVTARRTRQYPVDFGYSSSCVETITEPHVEAAALRVLEAARYTGLIELEFKFDKRDGHFKLLDANPRLWTWHALCRRAGVDFPYLMWRVVHGERVPPLRGTPGVRWIRMSSDLASAAVQLWRRQLSLLDYAASLKGPIEFATFAADDPMPALMSFPRGAAAVWRRFSAANPDRGAATVERSCERVA
jgi:phosphatidylserine decarboxylase precursor-related protein